jgi:preprotein translocase SecE subunit
MAVNQRATAFGPARDDAPPQRSERAARHIPGVQFIRECRTEMRKVVWPTREEATRLTIVVIAVSAATGLILGGFDYAIAQAFTLLR